MPNHDSRAIANEFLDLARGDGKELTHMAVQKLVYIGHGWNFALNGKDPAGALICDNIEAWDWGPVIPVLWDSLKRYGNQPIHGPIHQQEWRGPNENRGPEIRSQLTEKEREVIDVVYRVYGNKNAIRLSEITHEHGTPWEQVYQPNKRNIQISDDLIASHYRELARDNAA